MATSEKDVRIAELETRLEQARQRPDVGARAAAAEALSAHLVATGRETAVPDASPAGLQTFWPIRIRRRATFGLPGRHETVVDGYVPTRCAACGDRDGQFTYYQVDLGSISYDITAEVECRRCGLFSIYNYGDTTSPRWT